MTKADKLLEKLANGNLDVHELRTLLKRHDWHLDHTSGSHEVWKKGSSRFVLATHGKGLKHYQIKEARKILL